MATSAAHLTVEAHHPSAREYIAVAAFLFAMTIIEVAVYYVEGLRVAGALAPILLAVSAMKFATIGGFYMHLKMDHKLFMVFFGTGVALATTIILVLMGLFHQFLHSGQPIHSISTAPTYAQLQAPLTSTSRLGGSSIGDAEMGHEFFLTKGCVGCHMAPGVNGGGQIGPNQAHFSQRPTIAGGLLANTPENVERWLKDPPAVKPGTLMPNLDLTDEQIKDLTAYLYSLP